MIVQCNSTDALEQPDARSGSEMRLSGRWLLLARASWIILTLFIVTLNAVLIPRYQTVLQAPCQQGALCAGLHFTAYDHHLLSQLGLSPGFVVGYNVALNIILVGTYCALGALIFWRQSADRMALLCAFALVLFGGVGLTSILQDTLMPVSPVWFALIGTLCVLGQASFPIFFLLFPGGRFVPRWTRWVALGIVLYWAYMIFSTSIFSSASFLTNVVFFAILLCVVGVQVYRYRRVSTPRERQQTRWVVFGLCIGISGAGLVITLGSALLPPVILQSSVPGTLVAATAIDGFLLLIPLFIALAILRSQLYDIDLIVNRTLVYSTLTISTIGIYILVVSALGALLQARGNFFIALLATGIVAVLFQPLRGRIQRAINRFMFGERDTPNRVISRLGQRLETTLAPDAVLPTIVETVAQALKLPYTAITLKQEGAFVPAASYGQGSQEELVRFPLVYQNEQIGDLLLAPRAPGESFTNADRTLLSDLARQAGIAAHAVRLTIDLQHVASELQRSRTQLVTTREEERRRLRRDLHDGLGPALGSLTFQLDTARNLYKSDPPAADVLLVDLKAQVQSAIADIRRLVYELRPPTLDELGLVSALREQMTHYRTPDLSITLNVPELLPSLPAAVEVAIYRIAQEALTNMVRHANAQHCSLSLDVANDVCLEVRDDGQGLPAEYRAGVGLTSMRERAAELGGICVIEPVETGGTHVLVQLPLLEEEAHARVYPRADR